MIALYLTTHLLERVPDHRIPSNEFSRYKSVEMDWATCGEKYVSVLNSILILPYYCHKIFTNHDLKQPTHS